MRRGGGVVVGIDDDAVVAAAIGRPGSWQQVSPAISRRARQPFADDREHPFLLSQSTSG